jgi:hypothetical protein
MNRTVTSLLAIGLGVAAYRYAQRNNRTMRKMGRRLTRAIF